MSQAIENLTQLAGTIAARLPHSQLADYDVVTLDVERADPVEGKANLVTASAGSRLEVTIRRALLGAAGDGSRLRLRAKRSPDGVMAEPHPESENFQIE
jgi:hypothetical protein